MILLTVCSTHLASNDFLDLEYHMITTHQSNSSTADGIAQLSYGDMKITLP